MLLIKIETEFDIQSVNSRSHVAAPGPGTRSQLSKCHARFENFFSLHIVSVKLDLRSDDVTGHVAAPSPGATLNTTNDHRNAESSLRGPKRCRVFGLGSLPNVALN